MKLKIDLKAMVEDFPIHLSSGQARVDFVNQGSVQVQIYMGSQQLGVKKCTIRTAGGCNFPA